MPWHKVSSVAKALNEFSKTLSMGQTGQKKLKTLWLLFYGWGSTASRLQPLRGGSLLFTIQFPEIPGTHFIDLGRMKGWVDLGATQWFWTRDPWIGNCSNGLVVKGNVTRINKWVKVFKNEPSKVCGRRPWYNMICLSRQYHFNFFNGGLPQISLGPFLNT